MFDERIIVVANCQKRPEVSGVLRVVCLKFDQSSTVPFLTN
jgi:hypothetical protein